MSKAARMREMQEEINSLNFKLQRANERFERELDKTYRKFEEAWKVEDNC